MKIEEIYKHYKIDMNKLKEILFMGQSLRVLCFL